MMSLPAWPSMVSGPPEASNVSVVAILSMTPPVKSIWPLSPRMMSSPPVLPSP
jgi:hypothetical protein